jgi:hypothetical protein
VIETRISETIHSPLAEVFDYVTDPRNDSVWCPPVLRVVQREGDGPYAGAIYDYYVKPGPRNWSGPTTIDHVELNRSASYHGHHQAASFKYDYLFEAIDDTTTVVHLRGSLQLKLPWRLLEPIIRRNMRKVKAAEFRTLRTILEREPVASRRRPS